MTVDLSRYYRLPPLSVFAAVFVVLMALGLRLHHLDHESLWMDEIHQTSIYDDNFRNIVLRAASQQIQPPLDYWIGRVVVSFSSSDFAMRLPAALFGAGSVLLLMAIVARACSWPVALVAGTIMAMLPFHIYFSQEARPYSLPIFLLLALILSLNTVVKRDPPVIRSVFLLLIVSLCFLYSRALAPLVVVTALVMIVFLRFALSIRFEYHTARALQKRLLLACAIMILSIAIYLPAFRLILEMGQRYAPEASRLDLGVILDGISRFSFWPLWRAYVVQMEPLGAALLPLIVIAPILAVKLWKKDFLIFATAFLLPMACLLHIVIFRAKTGNVFRPPYAIYISPLALILAAFAYQKIADRIHIMGRGRILRGILVASAGLAIIIAGHRAVAFKSVQKKTDWRALCHYLESSFDTRQVLIFDSLKPYNEWEPTFYGFGRYYNGQSPCLSVEEMPSFAHLMAEDTSHEPIFILFYPRNCSLTPYSKYTIAQTTVPPFDDRGIKEDHLLTVTNFTGFCVIRIKNTLGNVAEDTLRIMESLIATLPSDSSTVELHLAAASIVRVLGIETFEDHLAKAESVAPQQALPRVRAITEAIRARATLKPENSEG